MKDPEWGDHFEHRLVLTHVPGCKGWAAYPGGMDQGRFCAGGCISINNGDFHLPVGKLAEFTETLYEAAGKPPPLILDRPEVDSDSGATGVNIFTVAREPAFRSISIRHHGAPSAAVIAPGPARQLAAVIAAYADAAEASDEPDPAEVDELASSIRFELHPDSGRVAESDRIAARTALRWMKQRREAS